jgi:hypothetical protein
MEQFEILKGGYLQNALFFPTGSVNCALVRPTVGTTIFRNSSFRMRPRSTAAGSGTTRIFALGAPGVIERLFADSGFVDVDQRILTLALRMPSAAKALMMIQQTFAPIEPL